MRNFGLQERVAICRAFVLPDAVEKPVEAVADSGVTHVIRAVSDPDTAVLLRTGGRSLDKIALKPNGAPISEAVKMPEVSVTDGYIAT